MVDEGSSAADTSVADVPAEQSNGKAAVNDRTASRLQQVRRAEVCLHLAGTCPVQVLALSCADTLVIE